MRPIEGDTRTGRGDGPPRGTTIELPLPLGDARLFRHGASEDVLTFLAHNPDVQLSVRMLADAVGHSEKATRTAVDALAESGLVRTERAENKRLVGIARDRLHRPDDPIFSIRQTPYQLPVRLALETIRDELDDVLGVVLFGSVARGEADRRSDIDLWVLAGGDRPDQLHRANEIASELEAVRIPPTVSVMRRLVDDPETDAVALLQEATLEDDADPASGQRYSFEILVETPESALQKTEEISGEIFREGIALHGSETLERIKREILAS